MFGVDTVPLDLTLRTMSSGSFSKRTEVRSKDERMIATSNLILENG